MCDIPKSQDILLEPNRFEFLPVRFLEPLAALAPSLPLLEIERHAHPFYASAMLTCKQERKSSPGRLLLAASLLQKVFEGYGTTATMKHSIKEHRIPLTLVEKTVIFCVFFVCDRNGHNGSCFHSQASGNAARFCGMF